MVNADTGLGAASGTAPSIAPLLRAQELLRASSRSGRECLAVRRDALLFHLCIHDKSPPMNTATDVLSYLCRAATCIMDIRFIAGSILGWRLVSQVFGRPDGSDANMQRQLEELLDKVAALEDQVAQKAAELSKRERDLADAAGRLEEMEFSRLTLESQICQLEANEVRLEADLQAGVTRVTVQNTQLAEANSALQEQNLEVLAQLRAALADLAEQQQRAAEAALAQAQPTPATPAASAEAGSAEAAPAAGAAPDEAGLSAAAAAELREENAALRSQLAAVLAQNADLQERLMALAFQPPEDPLEGVFSPDFKRPRHRPLAEDEEIQRRIAESAAQVSAAAPYSPRVLLLPQVALFGEAAEGGAGGAGGVPGGDKPLLEAAQRQLEAYQQIKQRLLDAEAASAAGGVGVGVGIGKGGVAFAEPSVSSAAESVSPVESPTAVLSLGEGLGGSKEVTAGEEVSSLMSGEASVVQ